MTTIEVVDELLLHLTTIIEQKIDCSDTEDQKKNENLCSYSVTHKSLMQPPLEDIQNALQTGLANNFKSVSVEIMHCPNLSHFANLSSPGICGNCKLADVGGVPFMFCKKLQTKNYSMTKVLQALKIDTNRKNSLIIGAAAAASDVVANLNAMKANNNNLENNKNAELVANMVLPIGKSHTKICQVIDYKISDKTELNSYPQHCESHGCLSNLFISDGHCDGNVIHIRVRERTGDLNFVTCLRLALKQIKGCGDNGQQIGMGGVIKVLNGKIRAHVMPCFTVCDHTDAETINKWLNFYEFGPNLIMFSCLVTDDPTENNSMHLRLEHTHFYSLTGGSNEGGHYHEDVTPDIIEYEAYFSLAESIWRVEDGYKLLGLKVPKKVD